MKDLKDLNLLDRFLWKRCSFEAPTPDRKRSTDFTSVSFC